MRTATWEAIGTDVERAAGVAEVLQMSDLDYEVEKVPVFLEDGTVVPRSCATKQVDSDRIFGVVSSRYEVMQNIDAFQFVDDLVPEGMEFVKAGEAGSIVYIIAKFPDRYVLGDDVTPYLIFQNSHSLASAIKFTISPLRILCQNQFNWAFSNASNKISIRHTVTASDRLIEAKDTLLKVGDYLDAFELNAEALAATHISPVQVDAVLNAVFAPEDPDSERSILAANEKKNLFRIAYNADDNSNFVGTGWGMVNAYADYLTHRPMIRDTEAAYGNRFVETTLGKDNISAFVNAVNTVA